MNRISRSWIVELMLRSSRPEIARSSTPSRATSAVSFWYSCSRYGTVDGDADVLHPGQHDDERVLDRRVQLGHALLGELRRDRLDEGVRRRARRGRRGPRRSPACRRGRAGRSPPGRRAARRTACSPRGGGRARSGPRPGRAGRRRSPCRARVRRARCPGRAASASATWCRGRGTAPRASAVGDRRVGRGAPPGSTGPRRVVRRR